MSCELCSRPLLAENASGWCAECALIVSARLGIVIEERWRDLHGQYVVSERGRVARLMTVDRSHRRYPRVSIDGENGTSTPWSRRPGTAPDRPGCWCSTTTTREPGRGEPALRQPCRQRRRPAAQPAGREGPMTANLQQPQKISPDKVLGGKGTR